MSRYRPVIAPSARKELKQLPTKIAKHLVEAIEALAEDPRPHGCLKLEGAHSQFRIRVGDYCLVCSIEDDILTVLLIRVRHRKEE
ncbi:MAG: type II toxin-antitoxin system RelE/ParE family toxin [Planctomycetes bacterium]|nr:type II toxin-antitoxin system RelE/ParE family toxin [Planctomycetota bacterium]